LLPLSKKKTKVGLITDAKTPKF